MAAADQLERILYIIPRAAGPDGASLAELARALDVDESTIIRDLEEATARVYYHPAGNVDPFDIFIDGARVRVHAPIDFKRPVRLNAREALALELGLRVLATDLQDERRTHVLELADRLQEDLSSPELTLQPVLARNAAPEPPTEPETGFRVDVGEDDVRGVFADAITRGRLCSFSYLKPGEAPSERTVAPRRLVYDNGTWYLAARDAQGVDDKLYRLDRVLRAEVLADPVPASAGNATVSVSPHTDSPELEAQVRYSPRVARWIAEETGQQCERDGTLLVTHKVVDPKWLVRHVLQYGGEAVVETPELRKMVADAAARISGAN
jgi:proteasome accessory factor C